MKGEIIMKCPKCKEGELVYIKRGVIEESYQTDGNGEPIGEAIDTEKDFYWNSHHYCEECDYKYDVVEKEEV